MRHTMRLCAGILFCAGAAAQGTMPVPYIGYVYPAGGLPGETLTVTIGGQYLKELVCIDFCGTQVEVEQTGYLKIFDRQEANRLRRTKEILEVKMKEETDSLRIRQMQRNLEKVEKNLEMVEESRREARMDRAAAARRQFNPQIAERIEIQLPIPKTIEPGEIELRVVATNGLSNPLRFHIGQIPEVLEEEPNNEPADAQRLPPLPVLVNGQIMPSDTDCFSFNAQKGQMLVIRADAQTLIPYLADAVPGWFQAVLTLYDAAGREIAYNDSYRFRPDPVLFFRVPKDGVYTVEIRDAIYRGREDFVYRLIIGELPFITSVYPPGGPANSAVEVELDGVNLPAGRITLKTSREAPDVQEIRVEKNGLLSNAFPFHVGAGPDSQETEPNDRPEKAQAVEKNSMINGRIDPAGDIDYFSFTGRAGDKKQIETVARRIGSPLDSRLTLFNAKGEVLAVSDDEPDPAEGLITHHADSRIEITLPESGQYFIRLEDAQKAGGSDYTYRLMITGRQPDFRLRVTPSSLRIPLGATAVATVHAVRYGGFTGPVSLSLVDPPTGLDLPRTVIPGNEDKVQIVLSAKEPLKNHIYPVQIEGAADADGRTVRRLAVPSDDMMQAFLYRHLVPARKMLLQVTDPQPVIVSLALSSDGALRVRPGTQVSVSASPRWNKTRGRQIRLMLSDPPEWLTLEEKRLPREGGEIIFNVSSNAEPGTSAVLLLKGTVNIPIPRTDPEYNPVVRRLNNRNHEFIIGVIPVTVIN